MKRIGKKTTKRVAAIILAAVAACSVMGCTVEKTVTTTETHTDADGNTVTTTTTQTTDNNGTVTNETTETTETAEAETEPVEEELPENPGFFDTDSWSITYDTEDWYGYVDEEGNTIINYLGECAGTSLIEISELDVATAKEAVAILAEKKGKELTVSDGFEGVDYTCFAYAADEVYETGLYIADFYTLYEHNGKVIVVDEMVTHDDDDARAEALGEVFAGVKNALVLK